MRVVVTRYRTARLELRQPCVNIGNNALVTVVGVDVDEIKRSVSNGPRRRYAQRLDLERPSPSNPRLHRVIELGLCIRASVPIVNANDVVNLPRLEEHDRALTRIAADLDHADSVGQ